MNRIKDSLKRIPLTVKTVLLTLIVGVSVWAALDYIVHITVTGIFEAQLAERLNKQATSYRYRFGRYVYSYSNLAQLIVSQTNLVNHVTKQEWSKTDSSQINYSRVTPNWFPGLSTLRSIAIPRYALLLDNEERVREVYQSMQDKPPDLLLPPSHSILRRSEGIGYLTTLGPEHYLISTEKILSPDGHRLGSLVLASPLDAEFLQASQGYHTESILIALVTGDENRILISSDPAHLPSGVTLDSVYGQHISVRQAFFEYGDSEMNFKFVSLVPKAEVSALTSELVESVRKFRAVIAIVFILTFAFISYFNTRRIIRVTKRISDFSTQIAVDEKVDVLKGDQLFILEQQFQQLTKRVIAANNLIRLEAEERNRVIVNNALDAIVTVDENENILTWNPRAETLFGYSKTEAIGSPLSSMVMSCLPGQSMKQFLPASSSKDISGIPIELTACNSDKHEFTVEMLISAVHSGAATIYICNIRNISERKRVEQELAAYRDHLEEIVKLRTAELESAKERAESADKMKSAFLATMSHELRTPLNAIIGFTSIILQGMSGPINDEQSEQLGMVQRSSHHLLNLINDVLDISKIEAGQLEVYPEAFNVRESIEKVIQTVAPLADNKKLSLVSDISPELGEIISDARRVEQILINLLNNAIKFTETGEVHITCFIDNNSLLLRIKDTGIGMQTEEMDKLFKPFQQIDSTIARHYEGTGLGLSICNKLLILLEGDIKVESDFGKGSTFTVTLPLKMQEVNEHQKPGG